MEKEKLAFRYCRDVINLLISYANKNNNFDAYEEVVKRAGKENPLRSSQDVQQYIYAARAESEKELNSGYASDRLYAILKSVSTENLVRKAPSLSDLHELTMQRERGGLSTAMFRALAPSILVLGILGTLLGVHNKLDEVGSLKDISALADALIPGALAVFFTVLVMFYRGWFYNKELAKFVSDFDEYTLKMMLPFFQPESQEQVDSAKLNQILHQVKHSKDCMEKTLMGVKLFHDATQQGESTCVKMLSKVQNNLYEISRIMQVAVESQQLNVQIDKTTHAAVADYLEVRKGWLSQFATLSHLLTEAEESFAQVYNEVAYPAMSRVAGIPSYLPHTQVLVVGARKLGAQVGRSFSMPGIETILAHLKSVYEKLSAVSNVFEQYREDVNNINEADNIIDSAVARMAAMGESAVELYNRLSQQYDAAADSSEQFRESFCSLHRGELIPAMAGNISTLKTINLQVKNPSYPPGVSGIVKRLQNQMPKVRDWYRSLRGRVEVCLLLIILIIWYTLVR